MTKVGLHSATVDREHFSSGAKKAEPKASRLVVRVMEARSLLASDVETGKSDPVCFLWCGPKEDHPDLSMLTPDNQEQMGILLTSVCPTTIAPIWNEYITFLLDMSNIAFLSEMKCLIFVRDEDIDEYGNASYDDLGMVEMPLMDLISGGRVVQKNSIALMSSWYTLDKCEAMRKVDGKIKLSFSLVFDLEDFDLIAHQIPPVKGKPVDLHKLGAGKCVQDLFIDNERYKEVSKRAVQSKQLSKSGVGKIMASIPNSQPPAQQQQQQQPHLQQIQEAKAVSPGKDAPFVTAVIDSSGKAAGATTTTTTDAWLGEFSSILSRLGVGVEDDAHDKDDGCAVAVTDRYVSMQAAPPQGDSSVAPPLAPTDGAEKVSSDNTNANDNIGGGKRDGGQAKSSLSFASAQWDLKAIVEQRKLCLAQAMQLKTQLKALANYKEQAVKALNDLNKSFNCDSAEQLAGIPARASADQGKVNDKNSTDDHSPGTAAGDVNTGSSSTATTTPATATATATAPTTTTNESRVLTNVLISSETKKLNEVMIDALENDIDIRESLLVEIQEDIEEYTRLIKKRTAVNSRANSPRRPSSDTGGNVNVVNTAKTDTLDDEALLLAGPAPTGDETMDPFGMVLDGLMFVGKEVWASGAAMDEINEEIADKAADIVSERLKMMKTVAKQVYRKASMNRMGQEMCESASSRVRLAMNKIGSVSQQVATTAGVAVAASAGALATLALTNNKKKKHAVDVDSTAAIDLSDIAHNPNHIDDPDFHIFADSKDSQQSSSHIPVDLLAYGPARGDEGGIAPESEEDCNELVVIPNKSTAEGKKNEQQVEAVTSTSKASKTKPPLQGNPTAVARALKDLSKSKDDAKKVVDELSNTTGGLQQRLDRIEKMMASQQQQQQLSHSSYQYLQEQQSAMIALQQNRAMQLKPILSAEPSNDFESFSRSVLAKKPSPNSLRALSTNEGNSDGSGAAFGCSIPSGDCAVDDSSSTSLLADKHKSSNNILLAKSGGSHSSPQRRSRNHSPSRVNSAINSTFMQVLNNGSLNDLANLLLTDSFDPPRPEALSASTRNRLYDGISMLLGRHADECEMGVNSLADEDVVDSCLMWVKALVRTPGDVSLGSSMEGRESTEQLDNNNSSLALSAAKRAPPLVSELVGHTKRDLAEALELTAKEPSKRGLLAEMLRNQVLAKPEGKKQRENESLESKVEEVASTSSGDEDVNANTDIAEKTNENAV